MIESAPILLLVLGAFLFLGFVGYAASLFNSLIQVRNSLFKAWANLDVLLLQRNEELAKLSDAAGAYARHERKTLEELTRLRLRYRDAAGSGEKARAENGLSGLLRQVSGAGEGSPGLKAGTLFLDLQERISELEGAIADRRAFFNESVKIYNDRCQTWPQAFFARILKLKPHPYLEVPEKKGARGQNREPLEGLFLGKDQSR